jgi:hypothetical protein
MTAEKIGFSPQIDIIVVLFGCFVKICWVKDG